jgi:hypothetical protein
MNPFDWKPEHRHAWVVISLTGAVAGLLFGFIHSPFFTILQTWQAFAAWLSFPGSNWPWPVFGFLVTGAMFYGVQLLRRSN